MYLWLSKFQFIIEIICLWIMKIRKRSLYRISGTSLDSDVVSYK